MITKHLTDDEIQQYALDISDCETKIVEHAQLCEECKARVATYHILFAGISQQQEPAFDFNLSELVLAQLSPPKSKFSPECLLIYLLAFVIIFLAGILTYLFRGHLLSLFAGITPLLIYLIVTTAIIVLIALGADLYKTYQEKMSTLDFH
jgi:hypothetical protein